MATFKGTTRGGQEIAKAQQAADAPFLSAGFWKKGVKVSFEVLSSHKSTNGPYVGVRLIKPESILMDGKDQRFVRIGNLAGITLARMQALAEAKIKYFVPGDKVYLECTGVTPPEKEGHSPSPNVVLEIIRPDEVPASAQEGAAA
jgi:hypothetical protein